MCKLFSASNLVELTFPLIYLNVIARWCQTDHSRDLPAGQPKLTIEKLCIDGDFGRVSSSISTGLYTTKNI